MKAIIVDDELSGREILKELLTTFCKKVQVVDVCTNVESAVKSIKIHQPDLVFLDIEMPNYAGYEIVDFFDEINFQIIFVTAYDQYALKAFQVAAIDYLLKPVDIEKLKAAVAKAHDVAMIKNYKEQLVQLAENMRSSEHKISYLDKGYRNYLQVNEIVALKANRAYTKIFVDKNNAKPIVIARNLSSLENELSKFSKFVRTHRSWIININYAKSYSKTKLEIVLTNGIIAKLSKQSKIAFEEQLKTQNNNLL